MRPADAAACAASSWVIVSLMWKVPPKAASGCTAASRRRGRRLKSRLILTWAPSGAACAAIEPAFRPSAAANSRCSTAGPTPLSTSRPATRVPSARVTAPSGSTEVTSAPVRNSAPAARAVRSRPPLTWPMPPTGTSQSPVPPPITWYRKQRFCRSDASSADANVPMSPSVRAMPRAMSDSSDERSSPPSGRCTSDSHRSPSRTSARISLSRRSGSVTVGKTAPASGSRRSESSAKRSASRASPVVRTKLAVVAAPSPPSTRMPRVGSAGSGV